MRYSNQEGWQKFVDNNTDLYGKGCVDFAKRWAELMESKIERGELLESIAEITSHDADIDGITGFMYGCAVSMLAQCWIHGEQLRKWHNLDCQLGDEGEKANEKGGVLNPALLNFK